MNKIFSFIKIALIFVFVLIYSSCGEDFLNRQPLAQLFDSTMETEIGVEGLLVGAYAHTTRGEPTGSAMGTDWVWASGASDDMVKGSTAGDQPMFNQVERYEVLENNEYLIQRWRDCYNGVSRCNMTLNFLKTTQAGPNPIAEARATQIKAEALYLRAWFHFSANKVFKKIPYIRTVDEMGGKQPDEIPNTDQGWTYIEADLDFAIANLPESWNAANIARATKYAAMTLKAQALLYQGRYADAAPILQDVIDNSGKSLEPDFFNNYNERTENNNESIFELQATTAPTGTQGSIRMALAVSFQFGPAAFGGWGFYSPTACLMDAYRVDDDGLPYLDIIDRSGPIIKTAGAGYPGSPGKSWILPNDMGLRSSDVFEFPTEPVDPRLDWAFARRGVDYLGWGIMAGQSWIRDQSNGGPWGTKKYTHFQVNHGAQNGVGRDNDRNFRYHRLTHVLLWRAECHVEADELEQARILVNMVRERVKTGHKVMGLYQGNTFGGHTLTAAERALIDWDKPAANYKVEPYPASHAAFATKEMAREVVRMEIRLEFASEGQRFFDLRRWGQFTPPVNGKPYDEYVLQDYIERDQLFRLFMTGATYSKANRYWPLPLQQIDLQKGVLTQVRDDECNW